MSYYLVCFYAAFALFGVSFLVSLFRERRSLLFHRAVLAPALLFNGTALYLLVLESGHLPSHFLFERFVELSLGAGLLLWLFSFADDTRRVAPYVLGMILCLFAVALPFPKEPTPHIFRFSLTAAQLFFQLEVLSFALILLSAGYYLMCLVERGRLPDERACLHRARGFLLVGFTLFLTSQFCGSIWSLQGWGDYWMWGKMSSAGVVVWFYLMFVIHLRYAPRFGRGFESGAGFSLFPLLVVYRMVWQP